MNANQITAFINHYRAMEDSLLNGRILNNNLYLNPQGLFNFAREVIIEGLPQDYEFGVIYFLDINNDPYYVTKKILYDREDGPGPYRLLTLIPVDEALNVISDIIENPL